MNSTSSEWLLYLEKGLRSVHVSTFQGKRTMVNPTWKKHQNNKQNVHNQPRSQRWFSGHLKLRENLHEPVMISAQVSYKDLKQLRREQQRKRWKSLKVWWAKQQICTCKHHTFRYISYCHRTTTTWNFLILFFGGRKHERPIFHFNVFLILDTVLRSSTPEKFSSVA